VCQIGRPADCLPATVALVLAAVAAVFRSPTFFIPPPFISPAFFLPVPIPIINPVVAPVVQPYSRCLDGHLGRSGSGEAYGSRTNGEATKQNCSHVNIPPDVADCNCEGLGKFRPPQPFKWWRFVG
jgi:hypothetical protein